MSNNVTQMAEEALQQLQPQQQNARAGNAGKGKVLKVLVFEDDMEQPKVSVAVPLGLVKWAGRLLPPLAKLGPLGLDIAMAQNTKSPEVLKLIREKYTDLDTIFKTISEMIEDGFDQLEGMGPFDFVTVQDEDTKVRVCIE